MLEPLFSREHGKVKPRVDLNILEELENSTKKDDIYEKFKLLAEEFNSKENTEETASAYSNQAGEAFEAALKDSTNSNKTLVLALAGIRQGGKTITHLPTAAKRIIEIGIRNVPNYDEEALRDFCYHAYLPLGIYAGEEMINRSIDVESPFRQFRPGQVLGAIINASGQLRADLKKFDAKHKKMLARSILKIKR